MALVALCIRMGGTLFGDVVAEAELWIRMGSTLLGLGHQLGLLFSLSELGIRMLGIRMDGILFDEFITLGWVL